MTYADRDSVPSFAKAIPTEYKGVKLKSRLEAQCAFMLDALRWKWEYEPKSFMLPNGVSYTPDFFVPDRGIFIECRGYGSAKGDLQIEGFSQLVLDGFRCGRGGWASYLLIRGEGSAGVQTNRGWCAIVPLVHCKECGWRLSTIGHGSPHGMGVPEIFCPSCTAPLCSENYESKEQSDSARDRVDRILLIQTERGKILLNGLPSENWDFLMLGCSEPEATSE